VRIDVVTIFPEWFASLDVSLTGKARSSGLVDIAVHDLRDWTHDRHRTVDDTPYGGGDGMLMRVEPLVAAIESAKAEDPEALVLLPTPRGKQYKQSDAKRLAASDKGLILVCPRYEGYDERVTEWVDEQFRIGNYVLTGGELPAMVLIDSVVRLLPGVLGGETSAEIESFQADDTSIEFPQYTRPEDFRGLKVPGVLLSGHHGEIEAWRQQQSRDAD